MRSAEIPRGGWKSTEIRETLRQKKALTCDPHMSETTSTEPLSRLQVGQSDCCVSSCTFKQLCRAVPVLSSTDAGGLSTTGAVTITLKETNDFPPQVVPVSGSVCKEGTPEASGLVVTAVDQDYPPHAAPFIFEIPDDLPVNWTVSQLNGTRGNSEVKVSVAPLNLT